MKSEKKKKSKKNFSKKIVFFFILILFFALGSFSEKYGWKAKINYFTVGLIENLSSKIFFIKPKVDKLFIDIKIQDYKELTLARNRRINNKEIDDEKWNNIKIYTDKTDKKLDAEIKLKGKFEDHFRDDKKWSFKIKIKDKSNINGLTRFNLQPPETLNYLNEWLFVKALQKENLINLKTDFVQLNVNGENFGIYTIQESTSKDTLEKNKRRDGPIIGFDTENRYELTKNFGNNSVNSLEQSFFRARIEPVRLSYEEIITEGNNLKKAIFKLDSFRKKKLKTSEVFDKDQMINSLIIKALFASVQYDWGDMNFYYNPFTELLEPILKEVHTIDKIENHHNNWWLDSLTSFEQPEQKDYFLELLYDDKEFYEEYLIKLNNIISNDNYIENLIKAHKSEYDLFYTVLRKQFFLRKIIGFDKLDVFNLQKQKIINALNPKISLNAYYLNSDGKNIKFKVHNIQSVPIKIIGIKDIKNHTQFLLKDPVLIDGYKSFNTPPVDNIINFKCDSNYTNFCSNDNLNNLEIIFKIISQETLKSKKIDKIFYEKNIDLGFKSTTSKNFDFIIYDSRNKIYKFKQGKWNLSQNLIFEKGVRIEVPHGTEIIFLNNSRIISYSPILFLGTKDQPIKLTGEKNINGSTGGLAVVNAEGSSLMENVIISNLSGLKDQYNEIIFSGAITYYNSKIKISDCMFSDNLFGDDLINIVRSEFEITDVKIENSLADAIDIDYSDGLIQNLEIVNSGNDALDFSFSNVRLINIMLVNVGDKGISAGENSNINISGLKIKKSKIGIASKDSSAVDGDNIEIVDSEIALASYIKKSTYNAPSLIISDSTVKDSRIDFLAEKNDSIIFNGSKKKKIKYNFSTL